MTLLLLVQNSRNNNTCATSHWRSIEQVVEFGLAQVTVEIQVGGDSVMYYNSRYQ
jgi:hypothetical protein